MYTGKSFRYTAHGWFLDVIHDDAVLPVSIQAYKINAADCRNFDAVYRTHKRLPYDASVGDVFEIVGADVTEQKRQADEIAADNDWLGEVTARQYGDADLTKPRMIVTKSFAERWTDNPDNYREHFGIDDVEVNR